MRDLIISVLYKSATGDVKTCLVDYHFKLFPTHKEVVDAFLEKFPNSECVAILSIMEFHKEDYNRFVSEKY